MIRLLLIILLVAGGWSAYQRYEKKNAAALYDVAPQQSPLALNPAGSQTTAFRCDGRQYCSQMTSCAEATYFLKNCPGVKMDGNNDGVPCEQQWCTAR